jgi:hypothetical protein
MHAASAYHAHELRAREAASELRASEADRCPVFLCRFDVIVMQQFALISLLDGPRPRRMNWPF